jgi:putative phosphoesterase
MSQNQATVRIGVISDTHGFLDPQVHRIFEGVEHILHAGDIGPSALIFELENIAPVTAVLGNTDSGLHYRETERVQLIGRDFLVHHIVDVHALPQTVQGLTANPPDVVVFGHSHKPHQQQLGRTLFLNPGYAGKPRFNMPRTVAVLREDGGALQVDFVPLDH